VPALRSVDQLLRPGRPTVARHLFGLRCHLDDRPGGAGGGTVDGSGDSRSPDAPRERIRPGAVVGRGSALPGLWDRARPPILVSELGRGRLHLVQFDHPLSGDAGRGAARTVHASSGSRPGARRARPSGPTVPGVRRPAHVLHGRRGHAYGRVCPVRQPFHPAGAPGVRAAKRPSSRPGGRLPGRLRPPGSPARRLGDRSASGPVPSRDRSPDEVPTAGRRCGRRRGPGTPPSTASSRVGGGRSPRRVSWNGSGPAGQLLRRSQSHTPAAGSSRTKLRSRPR
jgi:hypothetical protein